MALWASVTESDWIVNMATKKKKATNPGPQHQFLWMSLATTGIDQRRDKILEYAFALVEDAAGGRFDIVESETDVLRFRTAQHGEEIDAYVQRLHAANGLWEECEQAELLAEELDEHLVLQAKAWGAGRCGLVLAGAHVDMVRRFLSEHCPRFSYYLAYRTLSTVSLRELVRARGAPDTWAAAEKLDGRAGSALLQALEDADHFCQHFLRGEGE